MLTYRPGTLRCTRGGAFFSWLLHQRPLPLGEDFQVDGKLAELYRRRRKRPDRNFRPILWRLAPRDLNSQWSDLHVFDDSLGQRQRLPTSETIGPCNVIVSVFSGSANAGIDVVLTVTIWDGAGGMHRADPESAVGRIMRYLISEYSGDRFCSSPIEDIRRQIVRFHDGTQGSSYNEDVGYD